MRSAPPASSESCISTSPCVGSSAFSACNMSTWSCGAFSSTHVCLSNTHVEDARSATGRAETVSAASIARRTPRQGAALAERGRRPSAGQQRPPGRYQNRSLSLSLSLSLSRLHNKSAHCFSTVPPPSPLALSAAFFARKNAARVACLSRVEHAAFRVSSPPRLLHSTRGRAAASIAHTIACRRPPR